MFCMEFGKENSEVILLLHGGGLSWWNYQDAATALAQDYHVVLPVLDGHAQSDRDFTSIEENAAQIIRFIDARFGGSVLLIGGLSLGGQIALEILSQRQGVCRYALIESASVVPSALTHALVKPAFGSCHGLIRRKWFAKWQFQSLRIQKKWFDAYFRDTCALTRQNMIAFLQSNALYALKPAAAQCGAKVFVCAGGRENRAMRRSAAIIHACIPGSMLQILPGMYHGAFSINHPDAYVRQLRALLHENGR